MKDKGSYEKIVSRVPALMRSQGVVFMTGTKSLIDDFGFEGEKTARQWIRRVGTWRGSELRKAHMALGFPINMDSIMRYWDSASSYTCSNVGDTEVGGFWSPYNVRIPVDVSECMVNMPWAEKDFLWGHIWCDEFHQHAVQAYHSDAVVVIPQCLPKGDPVCDFRWIMPPNAKEEVESIEPYPGQDTIKDWQMDTEEEAALSAMRRTTRWYAVMIYFLWEVLLEFHPKEAELKFIKIMDQLAIDRGTDLKREKSDWGPEDLFLNLDLPYAFTWDTEKKLGAGKIEIEVSYCPLAETWSWLDGLSAMKSYCERTYSGIVKNYDSSFQAEVSRCKTKGDDTCLIKIEKT